MNEKKKEVIENKIQRESAVNTVGFIVFGFIVVAVILGCKTCSESGSSRLSKTQDMTACPVTHDDDASANKDNRLPAGHPEIPAGHPAIPAGHPAVDGAAEQSFENIPHFKGSVVETMNAGRYTYVCVDSDGENIWAAAPEFKVKVGNQVIVPKGMPMKDFNSPTLKRKFDTIYFAGKIMITDDK